MPAQSRVRPTKNRNTKKRPVSKLTPHAPLSSTRLPSGQVYTLRYSDQVSLNPGIASTALYQFRANDLYDPDYTSTGHQPIGFDQLMAFYNHFTVTRSRFRVHISQPTLTSTGNQWAAIVLTGAVSDVTSSDTLSTLKEKYMPSQLDWGFIGSANNSRSLVFNSKWITFDGKRFFGKKINELYADFQGTVSSSPAEQSFFNVLVGSWDASVDTDTVKALVEIEFTAVFSEPKPLPQS